MAGSNVIKPISRFFRLLAMDRRDIMRLYIIAAFAGVLSLTLPLGIQAIIGLITSGRITTTWVVLIFFVIAGTALSGAFTIIQLQILEALQQRIFTKAAFEFAHRIPRMQLDALSKNYPPELINRFFDVPSLLKGLPKVLMDFSTSVLQIIFGLALLGFYHPAFGVFGVFQIIILVAILYFTGPLGIISSIQQSKYKYEIVFWLEEMARSIETFKLSGNADLPDYKTNQILNQFLHYRTKHFKVLQFQFVNIVIFKTLVTAGLLILGSYLLIDKKINVGQFVASEIIIITVINSAEKLITTLSTIYDVLTSLDKIGAITDIPLEPEQGIDFQSIDNEKGMEVKLLNISYSHPASEHKAIDEISLEIKSGERVCIAGFNGSGKTSLVSLIAGINDNFSGTICYNGVPFSDINRKTLRSHIGDTLTMENIFYGTIQENIMLAKNGLDINDLLAACEKVGLKDFVQSLPEGTQTVLFPEDKRFPKSFRKKIALARSFAENPKLIALDELIVGLDRTDKELIYNNLTDKNASWTLVVVSHDESFAKKCDRIIVLREGKIFDQGSYDFISKQAYFGEIFC